MNLTPRQAVDSLKVTIAAYKAIPYTNKACKEILEKVQQKEHN